PSPAATPDLSISMSNSNGPDNNGLGEATDFSSFADFGRTDGLDADTMNLFGSFTNDTIQGGIGDLGTGNADGNGANDTGLGSLTNDLTNFGVDLSALEMGGNSTSTDAAAVDLSSIQLMNIDETPLNATSSMQNVNAADMVARLLAPGSQGMQQPVAIGSLEQQALGLSIGGVATQTAAESKPANSMVKSRSSSQSSDDMGDIPLAQLALMQPSAQNASQNPQMPASAAQLLLSQAPTQQQQQQQPHASQISTGAPAAAAVDSVLPYARARAAGQTQGLQIQAQASAATQLPVQMTAQQPQLGDAGVQAIGGMALGLSESLAPMPTAASDNAVSALTGPPHAAAAAENGSTGVTSTVLVQARPSPPSTSLQPPPPKLQFDLPRPASTLEDASLEELEEIEIKLCSLLTTASHAIRMMSGPRDPGQDLEALDLSESKLKPTIKEFMLSVAEVQAGMKHQHRMLATQRIPIHASAGLHSDVAGFERDLVLWSDAAALLADAIDT
ncbi:hypothetical protein LPJ56_005678, partial [Coemansia sp. RSA 2599]